MVWFLPAYSTEFYMSKHQKLTITHGRCSHGMKLILYMYNVHVLRDTKINIWSVPLKYCSVIMTSVERLWGV